MKKILSVVFVVMILLSAASCNLILWKTISFDSNAGTAIEDISLLEGTPITKPNDPVKDGYVFDGWYSDAAFNTHWDFSEAVTDDMTLYAKWINTYPVTLDLQSGTGGSTTATATFGSAMPTATAPTRTGYTFGGYYDAVNGGGTQYYTDAMASAQNWDKTSAATLYAKWTAATFGLTFDLQSGTGGSTTATATFGSAMPTATAPTLTGYTFGGYYDAENGGGTHYYTNTMASAQNWDKTSAATLYAKWTAVTFGLTFDLQSGTGGSTTATATYGSAMPTATAPTRTGYTFGGYYDAVNGGGTQYYTDAMASAQNWDKTSAATLYAKWSAATFGLTFDLQSGTGGSTTATATYGSAMPTATAPTRTGYTFGGYYDAENGGGTQYYTNTMVSAQNWDKTSAATLYAKWTAAAVELTFGQSYTLDITVTGIDGAPNFLPEGTLVKARIENDDFSVDVESETKSSDASGEVTFTLTNTYDNTDWLVIQIDADTTDGNPFGGSFDLIVEYPINLQNVDLDESGKHTMTVESDEFYEYG